MVTKAKKAIATFKLREGMPIGVKVTLRREKMWEFLDRLVTLGLPRVRDFRGTNPRGFDGSGNYTLGLKEQSSSRKSSSTRSTDQGHEHHFRLQPPRPTKKPESCSEVSVCRSGADMARASQWAKGNKPPKFSTRAVNRLPRLRPYPWCLSGFRLVPHLHAAASTQGRTARSHESELVIP